jgi:hypothetical protein
VATHDSIGRVVNAGALGTPPNKSNVNGGSVFRNLIRPATLELI